MDRRTGVGRINSPVQWTTVPRGLDLADSGSVPISSGACSLTVPTSIDTSPGRPTTVTVTVDDREPSELVEAVRAHDVDAVEVRRLDAGDAHSCDAYPTVTDLVEATAAELTTVEGSGPERAAAITAALHEPGWSPAPDTAEPGRLVLDPGGVTVESARPVPLHSPAASSTPCMCNRSMDSLGRPAVAAELALSRSGSHPTTDATERTPRPYRGRMERERRRPPAAHARSAIRRVARRSARPGRGTARGHAVSLRGDPGAGRRRRDGTPRGSR
ncbi:hypothetical protein BRC89_11060 [Halobacteriales archaeon QS_4_70_19]|nr:MAG: hypothetical protein BRC89_11060 [Halobacteriales archaeon QS_4_70_19]